MSLGKASGPACRGGGSEARECDQLGGSINSTAKQSRQEKQRLGRRAAYLKRQRLVAQRAEKKKAGKAMLALPASVRNPKPARSRGGKTPFSPGAAFLQDFARAIAAAERSGPKWSGHSSVRWQNVAAVSRPAAFVPGSRVHHQKFGGGIVLESDGGRLRILFDRGDQRCILSSFVEVA
jgi:hypothetical protein